MAPDTSANYARRRAPRDAAYSVAGRAHAVAASTTGSASVQWMRRVAYVKSNSGSAFSMPWGQLHPRARPLAVQHKILRFSSRRRVACAERYGCGSSHPLHRLVVAYAKMCTARNTA